MNTPICDFVRDYAFRNMLRLHMPGHKGKTLLGMEHLDLTEIDGADSLYEASGIIHQSEQNAGELFGCETYYSTEGSSQCIRAMLFLTAMHARENGKRPLIAAGRNAHKTFLSAASLLDLPVKWLVSSRQDSYLSCRISPQDMETFLENAREVPAAVYLTCPDYLGNVLDVRGIAEICHRYGVLLLVDNAHGAYLRFLPESMHPMDLGADLCCDSAHKTLPALTGAAYLHLSGALPSCFSKRVKNALAMFGSTSPSYLILQSLDAVNAYLDDGYPQKLASFVNKVMLLKQKLCVLGYQLVGDEPLKITISTKPYGYFGEVFSGLLRKYGVECEFADPDYVVFMLTPETGMDGLRRLANALEMIPPQPPVMYCAPRFSLPEQVMSVRDASLAPYETVSVSDCSGRVLAAASVGCPPAVPIVVSGERIDDTAIRCFKYYGIDSCSVVLDSFAKKT